MSRRVHTAAAILLALGMLCGCSKGGSSGAAHPAPSAAPRHDRLTREEFNRRAAAHFLPLFWRTDANHDGALQPGELAILWGYPESDVNRWIDQGGDFSHHFEEVYAELLEPDRPPSEATASRRHAAVLAELAQSAPPLVESDLKNDSSSERAMVRHLMRAAELIERLYARQKGVLELEARIPADDPASRALFHRNQSPYCEAPATQNDPDCTAVSPRPEPGPSMLSAADVPKGIPISTLAPLAIGHNSIRRT